MPVLYVVATPIGNLEDITYRAVRILGEVPLIAAEDTRSTQRLLRAYQLATPITSYHEHNKDSKLRYLMERLAADDLALVSEAGMPGISDPGYELIRAAIAAGHRVVPLPGPSAITTALAVSGLPASEFAYIGFLPRRAGDRRKLLASLAREPRTIIAFEAPHRIQDSLGDIIAALGDRPIAVARELTKVHEEIFRGTVSEAQARFQEPRGEFTLAIGPPEGGPQPATDIDLMAEFRKMRQAGRRSREAIAEMAALTGQPRKQLYAAWLAAGGERN